jgi:hypothetical protein
MSVAEFFHMGGYGVSRGTLKRLARSINQRTKQT